MGGMGAFMGSSDQASSLRHNVPIYMSQMGTNQTRLYSRTSVLWFGDFPTYDKRGGKPKIVRSHVTSKNVDGTVGIKIK